MSSKDSKGGVQFVEVDSDRAGQRLDNFLMARLKGVPKSAVYRLIRTGQVRINGKRCKAADRLDPGDRVRVPPVRRPDRDEVSLSPQVLEQVRQSIVLENERFLVLDKPSGMAVHAGSGLPWGVIDVLRALYPGSFLELAHRLDRETSGCLVIARSGQALNELAGQFRDNAVQKYYFCLLDGRLPQNVQEVDAPLARVERGERRLVEVSSAGKSARTQFRLLKHYPQGSFVEAELLTGRTHQIRAHARHLGMPLAGDSKYAERASLKRWRALGLKRIFLHAHRILVPGRDGEGIDVDIPLPVELRNLLDALE